MTHNSPECLLLVLILRLLENAIISGIGFKVLGYVTNHAILAITTGSNRFSSTVTWLNFGFYDVICDPRLAIFKMETSHDRIDHTKFCWIFYNYESS